jgi:hypothetical protein
MTLPAIIGSGGTKMTKKPIAIIPIAAALAALGGTTAATATTGEQAEKNMAQTHAEDTAAKAGPNVLFKVGENLLGLTVLKQADGTVLAQHFSHSSHGSHGSHRSHFSGF